MCSKLLKHLEIRKKFWHRMCNMGEGILRMMEIYLRLMSSINHAKTMNWKADNKLPLSRSNQAANVYRAHSEKEEGLTLLLPIISYFRCHVNFLSSTILYQEIYICVTLPTNFKLNRSIYLETKTIAKEYTCQPIFHWKTNLRKFINNEKPMTTFP